jgi:chromate transporter
MAAQAGFRCAGIAGAVIAPLGLVSPAIAVIVIVARTLAAFKENAVVAAVFRGFRPAAAGLLAAAGFGVWKLVFWAGTDGAAPWYAWFRWREAGLVLVLVILIRTLKLHPVVYIAAAGAAGLLLKL